MIMIRSVFIIIINFSTGNINVSFNNREKAARKCKAEKNKHNYVMFCNNVFSPFFDIQLTKV